MHTPTQTHTRDPESLSARNRRVARGIQVPPKGDAGLRGVRRIVLLGIARLPEAVTPLSRLKWVLDGAVKSLKRAKETIYRA